jgi:hypothetical protein
VTEPPSKPPIKFKINPDGSVTFEDLPPELLDLVQSLDPDAAPACDLPQSDDLDRD